MRKVKLHLLLKISGIFFTLKIFFSFWVNTVTGFFLIQGLQMFGWGLMAVGIVYYVNCLVKEKNNSILQGAWCNSNLDIPCCFHHWRGCRCRLPDFP